MRKVAWRVYVRSTVLLWAALLLFNVFIFSFNTNYGILCLVITVALALLVVIDNVQQGRDAKRYPPINAAIFSEEELADEDMDEDDVLEEEEAFPLFPPAEKSQPLTFPDSPPAEQVPLAVDATDENNELVLTIVIDNYNELISGVRESLRPSIIAEVDTLICRWLDAHGAAWRKYDRDRFFAFARVNALEIMRAERFDILKRVQEVHAGNCIPPTLSIGAGIAATPSEANLVARQALELALGRGGDQAIVKNGSQLTFFGGNARQNERRAGVQPRLVAQALRRLMEQSRRIVLMSHAHGDFDSFGAMLGIASCAQLLGKPVQFVYHEPMRGLEPLVDAIRDNEDFSDLLVCKGPTPQLSVEDLLILVDTQRASMTDYPELFQQPAKLVVIDHHLRGSDSVANQAILTYLEVSASSASELVTEITQYFDDNLSLIPMVAEALLAGIMVDTKRFAVNTSARTLEVASHLRQVGADARLVRELFSETRDNYIDRAEVVRNAKMLPGGIALAVCPPEVENSRLIAAQAADVMLTLRDIRAAFVLYTQKGGVAMSARSLGDVNVQRILERIGGGGGHNAAGAQLTGETLTQAMEKLRIAIEAEATESGWSQA